MKAQWWMTACATALLALAGSAAVAQDRGENRNQQNRQNQTQFDDHDRQVARDWYNQHQSQPGRRDQDKWISEREQRIQPGAVLDPEMRRMARPVPSDLKRGLRPAPRGSRYVTMGGHVVIVDKGNRVQDVIHLHEDR